MFYLDKLKWLYYWNKQSSNQAMEILNSLPKQNQNCLYITKIAPLKQSRLTFLNVRKQQGRLGSYNKQYTLYKVSGIPKCVLVWIWKEGLHLAGVGKQANEVCSKRKLSLRTTQQQAIMSMEPITARSFNCDRQDQRGRWQCSVQQHKVRNHQWRDSSQ